MTHIVRKRLRDGTIKEVRFGFSVEHSRVSGNMRDYFYKQDKGEIKGGEIRISNIPTHKFNR